MTTAALLRARAAVAEVRLETAIRDYAVRLIRATRQPGRVDPDLERLIRYGASPRASIALAQAAAPTPSSTPAPTRRRRTSRRSRRTCCATASS